MDGGVGIGQRRRRRRRRRVGVIPTRLYRCELAVLGGRRVAGGSDVGDILYQRQDRRDGVASSDDDWRGGIGATECAY